MSFDLFLEHFENGKSAEAPRNRVRTVLERVTSQGPSADGTYDVSFSDGSDVDFSADGLGSTKQFTGCAFHIRELSDAIIGFILDVARAGDMVIFPAMEPNISILVSEAQRAHVDAATIAELPPILVGSVAELKLVLMRGFNGWSAFRDGASDASDASSDG